MTSGEPDWRRDRSNRLQRVEAQEKWQRFWADDQTFVARDDSDKPRRYVLDMFPYPSGDLHMGHAEAYAMGDVLARLWRMQGYSAAPDRLGLLRSTGRECRDPQQHSPGRWTYKNIETQKNSFKRYGLSLDWTRELHTSDAEYYTGRSGSSCASSSVGWPTASSFVNWCPKDQTVLANEQVVNGGAERCHTAVTKQAQPVVFKITEYADRLLDDMAKIEAGG